MDMDLEKGKAKEQVMDPAMAILWVSVKTLVREKV